MEAAMGTEAVWNAEGERIQEGAPVMIGGPARAACWRRRVCRGCGERRPLFSFRGVVKADRHHDLCFACYRATLDRLRARRLGAAASGAGLSNPRPRPSKSVADRAALLEEIATRRRDAQIIARHALDAREAASGSTCAAGA
jgi:hypothetical protein